MNYSSALSYLDSLQSTNIKLGLERIESVCAVLDHPEKKFPSIIVAGTNGKGSTCAFLESILRHHGLKVGLYTSPHLVDVRERIQINREMISEEDFVGIAESVVCHCEPLKGAWQSPALNSGDCFVRLRQTRNDMRLTYFEFLTAMAFLYFASVGVDIAVLEVGLGGRFDATNLVTPLASVITRIGIDHQKYLGDTVEKIAFEKCGIIKERVPVVTVDQSTEVMSVIREVADKNNTKVWGHTLNSELSLVSPDFPLGLAGRHQLENAALAVRAAEIVLDSVSLRGRSPKQSPEFSAGDCFAGARNDIQLIASALVSTRWPGRLEIVSKTPLVILDGAHNPNGAEALARFIMSLRGQSPKQSPEFNAGDCFVRLRRIRNDRNIIIILGIMADKDMEGIIKPLAAVADDVIFTRPDVPRAADPASLLEIFGKAKVIEPLSSAISQMIRSMSPADVLIIAGSLYTVGEAKRFFRDPEPI